ncbi:hypothetical protein MNBD_NITROSPINAE01-835 [hydrothermal vent metagenome]|uniref:Uncharacterized protein n=1 Tax=hydrothermal vent metagenome TaxID=652676 RepID=A0A3B1BNV5_9ZZZZ
MIYFTKTCKHATFPFLSKLNFPGHLMASVYRHQISTLRKAIKASANTETQEWWEKYMRHVIPFHGVKMGDIRKALNAWIKSDSIIF